VPVLLSRHPERPPVTSHLGRARHMWCGSGGLRSREAAGSETRAERRDSFDRMLTGGSIVSAVR
jgi:hypothetical protein